MSWVLEIQDLQSSRKTVNTIETFWNVYRFATNQVRDETAKDNQKILVFRRSGVPAFRHSDVPTFLVLVQASNDQHM